MNYPETLDYLFSRLPVFQHVGAVAYRPGLERTLALLKQAGDPHRGLVCLHVAGTNGKGSSSHLLAAILQQAGYRVGLYTSPHLKDFRERIRINGQPIPEQAVVDFVAAHRPAVEELQPSFFEWTVGLAFAYFHQQKTDINVIEVGLGGRLDSTNVITPLVALITNISYDHTDLLGDTLAQIAAEKAGIIKAGVPVVVARHQPETDAVFIEKARQMQAPLSFASDEWEVLQADSTARGLMLSLGQAAGRLPPLWLDLPGLYQQHNLLGVLSVVGLLNSLYNYKISFETVSAAVGQVVALTGLKGRFQRLGTHPMVVADVAHNEDGIRQLLDSIASQPHRQLWLLLGVVREKQLDRVLALLPPTARYVFCRPSVFRGLPAAELAAAARAVGLQGPVIENVNEALAYVRQQADPQDLVVICGSNFLVADVAEL